MENNSLLLWNKQRELNLVIDASLQEIAISIVALHEKVSELQSQIEYLHNTKEDRL
jgi:hypothetical protein